MAVQNVAERLPRRYQGLTTNCGPSVRNAGIWIVSSVEQIIGILRSKSMRMLSTTVQVSRKPADRFRDDYVYFARLFDTM